MWGRCGDALVREVRALDGAPGRQGIDLRRRACAARRLGLSGPLFGWSDTWQLIINTGTTIITFLMVFLIQNTQNRDTEALHLKLDELIRATKGARDSAMELEDKSEEQLDAVKAELLKKPQTRRRRRTKGRGPQTQGPTGEPPAKPEQS
jgi:low affinity Fe/Cu permease